MNRKSKFVMVAMFKNEAPVLRNMLDSVVGYIDYYVIQDNGSTDGSPQIVEEWAKENNIPGVLYEVEEGWQGFGWNRDHLVRYCQNETDHGCDWILKMDCDETLEVYDDFDWSVFDDHNHHAFAVPAIAGTGVYYRSWIWNANLKWAFNHDPCHETIYCLDSNIGEQYNSHPLNIGYNQIGSNSGMSWAVPTKFISDALRLEEKLIREQNLLENMYHFWYIGKSYRDAMESSAFPLKKRQADEYARRSIWYLNEYINKTFQDRNGDAGIDEMCYMAGIMAGEAYQFMGKKEEAITTYRSLERFAPGRNDHLWFLVELYKETKRYDKMLETTTIMMDPERKFPFPQYCNFIDRKHYIDGTGDVQRLHQEAELLARKIEQPKQEYDGVFSVNKYPTKRFWIVDNFYQDPHQLREWALNNMTFEENIQWYKGFRSVEKYRPESIKHQFESIMNEKIVDWEGGMNGVFQVTRAQDPQVWHFDEQTWAAMIYLSPDAPYESGTRLHISKINNAKHSIEDADIIDEAFDGNFLDSTRFHTLDTAGNLFNRLAIFDARHIHSAGEYFGKDLYDGRLTHLFFFD